MQTKESDTDLVARGPISALILCTDVRSGDATPFSGRPACWMLPLVDRPFLQHVVESICAAGIRDIHIAVSHAPDAARAVLRDGTRWGVQITHHFWPDAANLCSIISRINSGNGTRWLIAWAHSCVNINASSLHEPSILCGSQGNTDWAWILATESALQNVPTKLNAEAWTHWLGSTGLDTRHSNAPLLRTDSASALLTAQEDVLSQRYPALISGHQIEPGIWLSRNVVLHPSTQVRAPAFIGADCRVGANAIIGPNAAIGKIGHIGRESLVTHSVVSPNTWLGDDLELRDSIVMQSRIWRALENVELTITDAFIASKLVSQRKPFQNILNALLHTLGRLFCGLLFLASLPLALCLRLLTQTQLNTLRISSNALEGKHWIALPARNTQDFSLAPSVAGACLYARGARGAVFFAHWFWPGLAAVASGKFALFGFPARTQEEIEALDPDWRDIYLDGSVGLIEPGRAEYGAMASQLETQLAEMHFAANHDSIARNLRLLYSMFIVRNPAHGVDLDT